MKYLFLFVIIMSFLFTGCAEEKDDVVTIHTKYGDMIAILYDGTPKHKKNFIKLANKHFYDSLLFHRVIQGFMIQGGDPNSKHAPGNVSLGNGDPGYTIDAEINEKYFHEKGALAAARLGDQQNPSRASNGSQFYIVQGNILSETDLKLDQEKFAAAFQQVMQNPANKSMADSLTLIYQQGLTVYEKYLYSLVPRIEKQTGIKVTRDIDPLKVNAYTSVGGTPMLDGEYTVFGKIIKGLEVIDSIAKQPTQFGDRPVSDIRMEITTEEIPRNKITTLYGYTYPEKTKN